MSQAARVRNDGVGWAKIGDAARPCPELAMARSNVYRISQQILLKQRKDGSMAATDYDHRPKRPGFALRFLIGLILVPLGLALRVMTQIYLEITTEAVHYASVMGFVTVGHAVLVGVAIVAFLTFRRRPLMTLCAVQLWAGYGIGAALLALKDMG
jgi:hypothetical protein